MLSLIAPGVGQLYNGAVQKALLFLLTPILPMIIAYAPRQYGVAIFLVVLGGIHADAVIGAITAGKTYQLKRWNKVRFYLLAMPVSLSFGFVTVFVFQPVTTEGDSMAPAVMDKDMVLLNKAFYALGWDRVERGDIVVYWNPQDAARSNMDRIIGVPGEAVDIRRGVVFIDNVALPEPYVRAQDRDSLDLGIVVPEGQYFVLGDHRNSSMDSRNWGCVPRASIYGRVAFVYWPPTRRQRVRRILPGR